MTTPLLSNDAPVTLTAYVVQWERRIMQADGTDKVEWMDYTSWPLSPLGFADAQKSLAIMEECWPATGARIIKRTEEVIG